MGHVWSIRARLQLERRITSLAPVVVGGALILPAGLIAERDGVPGRYSKVVEPDGTGSVVTYDADLRLNGILGIGDLGLRLMFGRIGDRAAAGLRRALGGQVA